MTTLWLSYLFSEDDRRMSEVEASAETRRAPLATLMPQGRKCIPMTVW